MKADHDHKTIRDCILTVPCTIAVIAWCDRLANFWCQKDFSRQAPQSWTLASGRLCNGSRNACCRHRSLHCLKVSTPQLQDFSESHAKLLGLCRLVCLCLSLFFSQICWLHKWFAAGVYVFSALCTVSKSWIVTVILACWKLLGRSRHMCILHFCSPSFRICLCSLIELVVISGKADSTRGRVSPLYSCAILSSFAASPIQRT